MGNVKFLKSRFSGVLLLVLIILQGCGKNPMFSGSYADRAVGKIAFMSDRDGDWEIYLMDADGSGVTQLTFNSFADVDPSFSSDGKRIIFSSNREGGKPEDFEVYTMNYDGSNQIRITTNSFQDRGPRFSYDGSKIVFYRIDSKNGNNAKIWAMYSDGSGERVLTADENFSDKFPCFSPDGVDIIFQRTNTTKILQNTVKQDQGIAYIYTMKSDGSFQYSLFSEQTQSKNMDSFEKPYFGANGEKIVFKYKNIGESNSNSEIFIADIEGKNQIVLTQNKVEEDEPVLSKNNKKIAYASNHDGNWEIYVMNVNGSKQIRLTNDSANDRYPTFSP
ncbi:MAG: hypothetical protein AABY84_10540 [Candidatus Firestonebacteria bacterium]